MKVQGGDCSIVIKTSRVEMNVPYSSETLREAVSMLYEEPAIEGSGIVKAIRKQCGVTGCVVTPLTIGTAPLLLYLAMGSAGSPFLVSETRSLYRYGLNLLPLEDTDCFDLIQDRGTERKLFEACKVKGFELRIIWGEALKLKLDIAGESVPSVYPYTDTFPREQGERFNGDCVTYSINGREYKNIYGLTLLSQKENGTKVLQYEFHRFRDGYFEIDGILEEGSYIWFGARARLFSTKFDYVDNDCYKYYSGYNTDLPIVLDEQDFVVKFGIQYSWYFTYEKAPVAYYFILSEGIKASDLNIRKLDYERKNNEKINAVSSLERIGGFNDVVQVAE